MNRCIPPLDRHTLSAQSFSAISAWTLFQLLRHAPTALTEEKP